MAQVQWELHQGKPAVEVLLTLAQGGQAMPRRLLADTGAGSVRSPFELILDEDDCLFSDSTPDRPVSLQGAYQETFPTYWVRVQLPALGFDQIVRVIGVPSPPNGFEGIACFRFLNRFHFGNFANPGQFGLEMPTSMPT